MKLMRRIVDRPRGVPQNRAEPIKLYRLAAEQGNAHARDNLGFVYIDGVGVQRDYAEAAKWFRKAADQGNSTRSLISERCTNPARA